MEIKKGKLVFLFEERGKMREERGERYLIIKHPLRVRNACVMPQRMIYHPMIGISTLNYSVASLPSIISTQFFLRS